MFEPFQKLTSSALNDLASSLIEGSLSKGLSAHIIQQITGSILALEITRELEDLLLKGWDTAQIGQTLSAMVHTRSNSLDPESLFDLVISGIEVAGVPTRDTSAVVSSMIENSKTEVLLVGYTFYNTDLLFKRLAEKIVENPDLHVSFCLNIDRKWNDTSLDSEIVQRFVTDFLTQQWIWEQKPEVFYDPRSLSHEGNQRTSLHAKCLIVDREIAFVTSANFTEAAQKRNVEIGVIIQYQPFVQRLVEYFDVLMRTSFKRCL